MAAQVAIIGAGPAGLTLARLFELNGIPYVVFERDASFDAERQGGSLDIHINSGQLALEACGLMDQFRAVARYDAQELTVLDSEGNILMREEYVGQEKTPEIDRSQLRSILLESVPKYKVLWGAETNKIVRDGDGTMSVHFVDGQVAGGFKLVVGADGAWSKVRKLVTEAMPRYSGFYYLQSEISTTNESYQRVAAKLGPGSIVSIGSGRQIAAQRLADGRYNIYVCLRLPEDWSKVNQEHHTNPEELRNRLLKSEFSDWSESLKDLIRNSQGPFHAWPLFHLPADSFCWKTIPGVVLVGDAAHLSTPFVGEGVNCSMYDSLQLAQAILKNGTSKLINAVTDYEEQMFPRAEDLVTRSCESQRLTLADDAPRAFKNMLESLSARA